MSTASGDPLNLMRRRREINWVAGNGGGGRKTDASDERRQKVRPVSLCVSLCGARCNLNSRFSDLASHGPSLFQPLIRLHQHPHHSLLTGSVCCSAPSLDYKEEKIRVIRGAGEGEEEETAITYFACSSLLPLLLSVYNLCSS